MNLPPHPSHITPERRQGQRPQLSPNPKGTLRQQVHEVMRFFHYSERTEETYWQWIERFLRFHRRPAAPAPSPQPAPPVGAREKAVWRHPREMGAEEVRAFLTHLATDLQVSASTQNQALNALVFLYGEVLHQPLGELEEYARVQRAPRVPEVLSREETKRVLAAVEEELALPLQLLYGSGMRVFELLRLRVHPVR
jgi:integrase